MTSIEKFTNKIEQIETVEKNKILTIEADKNAEKSIIEGKIQEYTNEIKLLQQKLETLDASYSSRIENAKAK